MSKFRPAVGFGGRKAPAKALARTVTVTYYPVAHDHLNSESGPLKGSLFLFW